MEQDAIRSFGRRGFRYVHETKKAVEFEDSTGRIAYLNREHSGVAVVLGFGTETAIAALPSVISINLRASSNFADLGDGLTRNNKLNHQGLQVVLRSVADIETLLETLS